MLEGDEASFGQIFLLEIWANPLTLWAWLPHQQNEELESTDPTSQGVHTWIPDQLLKNVYDRSALSDLWICKPTVGFSVCEWKIEGCCPDEEVV